MALFQNKEKSLNLKLHSELPLKHYSYYSDTRGVTVMDRTTPTSPTPSHPPPPASSTTTVLAAVRDPSSSLATLDAEDQRSTVTGLKGMARSPGGRPNPTATRVMKAHPNGGVVQLFWVAVFCPRPACTNSRPSRTPGCDFGGSMG
jgi:hypothetical protein